MVAITTVPTRTKSPAVTTRATLAPPSNQRAYPARRRTIPNTITHTAAPRTKLYVPKSSPLKTGLPISRAPMGTVYHNQKPIRLHPPLPRAIPLSIAHRSGPRRTHACGVSRSHCNGCRRCPTSSMPPRTMAGTASTLTRATRTSWDSTLPTAPRRAPPARPASADEREKTAALTIQLLLAWFRDTSELTIP